MKFRVFEYDYAWSYAMIIFPIDIKYEDIKNNPSTSYISKENFIGVYEFDANFLKLFDYVKENNIKFFRRHLYSKEHKPDILKKDYDDIF